jgi:hypothetical protein
VGFQIHTLDVLHDQIGSAGLSDSGVVELEQIGVMNPGLDSRLSLEASQGLFAIELLFLAELLDGHPTLVCQILGEIDAPHPPLTDLL